MLISARWDGVVTKRWREEVNMSTKTVNAVALTLRALESGDVAGIGFDVDHGVEVDGVEVAARASDASDEVVRKLRDKLECYHRHRAKRAGWVRRFVPTGLWPLDELLPHGGLPCGAITEIYADFAGVGSMTLALRLAGGRDEGTKGRDQGIKGSRDQGAKSKSRKIEKSKSRKVEMTRGVVGPSEPRAQATGPSEPRPSGSGHERLHHVGRRRRSDCEIEGWRGRDEAPEGRRGEGKESGGRDHAPIVVIDAQGDFYPPAVVPFGIALDRLIVLRVRNAKDALWAAEQSLRCSAVAAVIAPLERINERDSRRLQLAAETSGCIGIVLRPMHRRTKSFAAVQMLVEGGRGRDEGTEGRRDEGEGARDQGSEGSRGKVEKSKSRDDALGGCHGQAQRRRVSSHSAVEAAVRVGFHVDRSTTVDFRAFEEGALRLRDGYFCRITLLAVREGMPTSPCWVDLYHETGTCDVRSLPVDRPVAKTG